MFFCPDCHVSNRSDAKFCRKCGKSRLDLERADVAVAVLKTATNPALQSSDHSTGVDSQTTNAGSINSESATANAGSINSESATTNAGSINSESATTNAGSINSESATANAGSADSQSATANAGSTQSAGAGGQHRVNGRSETELTGEIQVAEGAPPLAVNIEQTASLSPADASAPQCPSCWEMLRATDKFCCWCGEAQPNRVLPFMKLCLDCSTFLPEKANYCYSCGTDVGYTSRRKIRVPHELFKDEESEFFPRFEA